MRIGILLIIATVLVTGCSSYRGTVWVMKIDSSPTGARIFSGSQPQDFLGTTPCYASIPAQPGGKIQRFLKIWAIPPTNCPSLYPQSMAFGSPPLRVNLPPELFFDLSKPPSAPPSP
jgi:hypothetical protein